MPEIQTIVLSVDSALDRMPERRLFPSDLGFAVGAGMMTGRGVGLAAEEGLDCEAEEGALAVP